MQKLGLRPSQIASTETPVDMGLSSKPVERTGSQPRQQGPLFTKPPELPKTLDVTRQRRNPMSKLKSVVKGIKEGRSSFVGSLGIIGSSTANQKPSGPGSQVDEPGVDGKGTVVLTPADKEKLGKEVRQA